MRQLGLHGVSRRRGFTVTTERDENARPAPDLVKRQFAASGPDQLWVSDITYVSTWAGFIFLAIVLDVWSRKIVGWSIGQDLRTELVLEALNMALAQRDARAVIPVERRCFLFDEYSALRAAASVIPATRFDDGTTAL